MSSARPRPAPPARSPLTVHESWSTGSTLAPPPTDHLEPSPMLHDAPPMPSSPRKPFNMAELAAAAMARPRSLAPWAERDECPASPSSSYATDDDEDDQDADAADDAYDRWNGPSSCAMTPSSSAGSFCLPPPSLAAAPPRSPVASTSHATLPPSLSPPPTPPKPTVARASPLPLASSSSSSNDPWAGADFSLKLLFTPANGTARGGGTNNTQDEHEQTLPPAFFPSQRISFSPRLRITSQDGLAFSSLGGMHLGVTGMCETLDVDGQVKSKRMIADFCIDLSSGLKIWKRDADNARKAAAHRAGRADTVDENETRLPPGTYVLPLSMKVPNSERLPPSFECAQFRISYTMSIALFSTMQSANGTPRRLKVFSIPFHVLPSTLPSPAPELPVLTHDHKKGMFASLIKSLSFSSSPRQTETGYHIVYPSLPTSHFSPGSHASIPVSLRIVDRPLEPTDLYIRLAIVRKTYVRESSTMSLASAIEDEWGLGTGVSLAAMGYPEEVIVEPWCKDEEEIVSRWGWVPYSARPGADPTQKAEVVINDIALPLIGKDGHGWDHGYSSSLDLEPTSTPTLTHGECSWFSPSFRNRPPVAKEYSRHVHVSSRFFLSVEVGFASPVLSETLSELGQESPDLELPAPNSFTRPTAPRTSRYSGASISNPFHVPSSSSSSSSSSSHHHHEAGAPPPRASSFAFPGKLRELLIPITIGSVAEPGLACFSLERTEAENASRRHEREQREERGEDVRAAEGEGPDGAWLCAPPKYEEAVKVAPAYL